MYDELQQVARLMEELPVQQQEVIKLRMKEYSIEEIERITGLSAANVRTTLSRGRKKIKELYGNICLRK